MRPREHYVQQLEGLHTEIRALGQMVIVSITRAIDTLRRQNVEDAKWIIDEDQRIDQAQAALEEHALVVMATQQPTAGDLRQSARRQKEDARCDDETRDSLRIHRLLLQEH